MASYTPTDRWPAQRALALAGPNSPEYLLERSTRLFASGKRLAQEGQTARARQDFDQALGVLTSAPLPENPADRRRIVARIEELADSIYRYDLDQLGAGATDAEIAGDSVESILEMTFPIDPSLRGQVREQIQATTSQLPLEENDAVLSYIHYFLTERGRRVLTFGYARSGQYRVMILRTLKEQGLPAELLFVAQVESHFDPRAVSSKSAVGMWQFINTTGIDYGLTQNASIDLRRDPEKATRSAARYLRDLYEHYGDWYLAMAAYNCGQGCVDNAIMRTGYADFWELRRLHVLPLATANYVPAVLAMTILFANRETYGLEVEFDDPANYESRELQSETSITLIAQAVDRPVSELKDLNPALLRNTAPAGYMLRLPPDSMERLDEVFAVIPAAQRKSWRIHRVEEGDTLLSVSKQYKLTEAQVSAVNHGRLPRPGSLAAIPVPYPADAPKPAPKVVVAKKKPTATGKTSTSKAGPAKQGSAARGKGSKSTSARVSGA